MKTETINEIADVLKEVVYVRATDLADAIHTLELFTEAHGDQMAREQLVGTCRQSFSAWPISSWPPALLRTSSRRSARRRAAGNRR